MFCRVCGFRVRVWESYRTSSSFGYKYKSVTEIPEVPGVVARAYRTHRSSARLPKGAVPVPRVLLWHRVYRTHTGPGYGYECPTELSEVRVRVWMSYRTIRSSGTDMNVLQNFQNFRVLWHGRTELTQVSGTGMNTLQNLQKFRVRVISGYMHTTSGGRSISSWGYNPTCVDGMFSLGRCPRGNLS